MAHELAQDLIGCKVWRKNRVGTAKSLLADDAENLTPGELVFGKGPVDKFSLSHLSNEEFPYLFQDFGPYAGYGFLTIYA